MKRITEETTAEEHWQHSLKPEVGGFCKVEGGET